MAMTLPQRRAPADTASDAPHLPLHITGDRGPANAVIARLAQAIAEDNASNRTEPAATQRPGRGLPKLYALLGLALGSATLWIAIILAISALV